MYKKGIYSILSLLVLFGSGCKRETLVGEKVIFVNTNPLVTNSGLTVVNVSPDSIFTKIHPSISFAANFTADASWTIRIEGKASKAYKEIKGTGKVIDNSNSVWKGDATSMQFFMKNDTCKVSLYVQGIDTAIASNTVVIKNMNSYHLRTVDGVRYLLVDDFDGNHMGSSGMTATSVDPFDNGTTSYYAKNSERINGYSSFHIEGTDINNNGWLFSMNHLNLVEMVNTTDSTLNILEHDPSRFYVNLYIRGSGKVNSAVELKIYEYDSATTAKNLQTIVNTNPYFYTVAKQAQNDGWIYIIDVNWEGWKLVSIPYSEFRVDNGLTTGGSGNHIKEPWKITGMAVSLLSDPQYGYSVAADIDFVVLSEGGAFVPKY